MPPPSRHGAQPVTGAAGSGPSRLFPAWTLAGATTALGVEDGWAAPGGYSSCKLWPSQAANKHGPEIRAAPLLLYDASPAGLCPDKGCFDKPVHGEVLSQRVLAGLPAELAAAGMARDEWDTIVGRFQTEVIDAHGYTLCAWWAMVCLLPEAGCCVVGCWQTAYKDAQKKWEREFLTALKDAGLPARVQDSYFETASDYQAGDLTRFLSVALVPEEATRLAAEPGTFVMQTTEDGAFLRPHTTAAAAA